LKQFPLTALKIDKSFVRDIPQDPDDVAIVTATIALAHSLRLRAIAEGVEKQAQLDFLTASRCDEIQGYLIGRPMSAAKFKNWMDQHTAERDSIPGSSRRTGRTDNNLVVLDYGRFGKAGNIC
jgi:EAL domain-containing protein (putative c-di-GMP-specific phosphodiesterase class I)